MRGLDARLDVVRVVVPPANHHHVLDPPRDEELAILDEPQVAGAQKGAASFAFEPAVECRLRLGGPVPVPPRDRGTANPDLAHRAVRAGTLGFRIDNANLLVQPRPAAADDHPLVRCSRGRGYGTPLLESG